MRAEPGLWETPMRSEFRQRPQKFLAMFMLLAAMLGAAILFGITAAPLFMV